MTKETEKPKSRSRQAQLGQYFTPNRVSIFMAGLFPVLPEKIQLLDAGAGRGALTAAFIKRWQAERDFGSVIAHSYEIDETMLGDLQNIFHNLSNVNGVSSEIFKVYFIKEAASMIRLGNGPRYTHAILNPPYKK